MTDSKTYPRQANSPKSTKFHKTPPYTKPKHLTHTSKLTKITQTAKSQKNTKNTIVKPDQAEFKTKTPKTHKFPKDHHP